MTHRLDPRSERRAEALVGAAHQDDGPLTMRVPCDLGSESRLADAGLAHEHDRAARAGAHLGPGRGDHCPLEVPTDQRQVWAVQADR